MNFLNQSNVAGNGSFAEGTNGTLSATIYFRPKRQNWYWVLMGLICVVATIGNSLVIFLVCSKRSFRNKVSPNWFILSLGVADLLTGSFNIPVQFVCSFTTKCTGSSAYIMYCFMAVFLTASTTNVCLLTFDIYIAVFNPFWYPNLMSPTKSRIFIMSSWIFSTLLNIAMFISATSFSAGNMDAELADQVITILFYTLSGAFLTYAFGRILLVVKRHKNDIEKHQVQLESNVNSRESLTGAMSSNPRSQVRRRNRDGTITATGVVTASFIICNGIWEYKLVHLIWPQYIPMNRTMVDITHVLIYCNCSMNFIVYALLRNDLRGELERYFRKICKKGNKSEIINLNQVRQANRQTGTLILPSTKDEPE